MHEHTIVSVLIFVTRLTTIKSKFAFSNKYYKELLSLISDVLPNNHKMLKDMYQSLKYGKSRFVEVVNEDGEKVTTKVTHKQLRCMPLMSRMKQLFLSKKTARHMR
jgi:hypothetical protein